MTNNELIAEWLGWEYFPMRTSEDIAIWHGEDGILAEIGRRGSIFVFLRNLVDGQGNFGSINQCDLWGLVNATPDQLTTALVKMIEEE